MRFKKKTVSYYLIKKKFKRLKIGKISKSGRNIFGKIVNLNCQKGKKKSLISVDFVRR